MTNLDGNRASIDEAVDAGLLAGAVTLIWHRGKVIQCHEVGRRDVEADLPMRRDTLFRVASMTKPVTVAAAMTFVDQGRLSLTDPVAEWLPELAAPRVLRSPDAPLTDTVPAERPLTVDDLMTHRGGLAYSFTVGGALGAAYRRLRFGQSEDGWLADLAALPLVGQPGARLTYGHSTDVLGILLSRLTGQPFADVLTERVLGPLGMDDTDFAVTADGRGRAATMYRLGADGTLDHDAMPPARITRPPFCMGGSGLWSSADDYLRFVLMLLGEGALDGVRVLSAESARAMRTNRLTDEQRRHRFLGMPFWQGRGFGLNLSVVTDPAQAGPLFGPGGTGSFGWPGAWGTWWQADPVAELVIVYLVQNMPAGGLDAAAVAGNTSQARLLAAQPKFVRRTYAAL